MLAIRFSLALYVALLPPEPFGKSPALWWTVRSPAWSGARVGESEVWAV